MTFDQVEFAVRCEWGVRGMQELAPISEVVIIVDVLSFTTSVEIATSRGGVVYPYLLKGESAALYAASVGADLAGVERGAGFSLSPASLQTLPAGSRIVLPSPNGAALAFASDHPIVLCACLRNAAATGRLASTLGSTFAVIPAGETWADGALRPAVEDLIGAGAVIASLPANRSPEASAAFAAFEQSRKDLSGALRKSSSGKELIERRFISDVDLASELNVSTKVPRFANSAFT